MSAEQNYRNRRDAGRRLAAQVREQLTDSDCVVLALPRGGVPIGCEIARAIGAPLDVLVVRKLGVPGNPEVAMGALAAGGFEVLNVSLVTDLGISPFQIAAIADREAAELQRREELYRGEHPLVDVRGRVAILVDDGLATGFTMRAAVGATRNQDARKIIVAVPVGAPDTCAALEREVDALICPLQPEPFEAVGRWYDDFAQTSDEEVRACLAAAAEGLAV